MHCLEVIIKRNSEAAGREMAHAERDGNVKLAHAIDHATNEDIISNEPRSTVAYFKGQYKGEQE